MNDIKKNFGILLKQVRKQKKFSQEILAEKIGINIRQLARIEAGESFITSETLYNICETLRISPKILFDFQISENNDIKMQPTQQNPIYKKLKSKLDNIATDTKKLEFINIAFDSIYNKHALKSLKLLIKGLELKS